MMRYTFSQFLYPQRPLRGMMVTAQQSGKAMPKRLPPAHADKSDQVVCASNIGPREQRKRLIGSLIILSVSFGLLAALIVAAVNPWWRIALFLPFWSGGISFFQARAKT